MSVFVCDGISFFSAYFVAIFGLRGNFGFGRGGVFHEAVKAHAEEAAYRDEVFKGRRAGPHLPFRDRLPRNAERLRKLVLLEASLRSEVKYPSCEIGHKNAPFNFDIISDRSGKVKR